MRQQSERRKIDGAWVKALRTQLDLNQSDFADRLGVSRSAVARWELDSFRPTKLAANALLQLAAATPEDKEPKSSKK